MDNLYNRNKPKFTKVYCYCNKICSNYMFCTKDGNSQLIVLFYLLSYYKEQ